jgi:hypothetical protein
MQKQTLEQPEKVPVPAGQGAEVRALAPHPVSASPLDLPAEVFRAGLDRRKENRAALMEWIRAALVEGVDYGRIHVVSKDKCRAGKHCTNATHFSKPSLFKPGAEKICGMLGVGVHFPTLHDYEQAALHGVELHNVIIRCEIRDAAGHVVADGVGARSLKQDYGDINKALKMAEKSAHIDATLRMAGLSEVFTQDLEDMTHGENVAAQARHKEGDSLGGETGGPGADAAQGISETANAPSLARGPRFDPITEEQQRVLDARIGELGLDRGRVESWIKRAWKVGQFRDLTTAQFERLGRKLEEWAAQPTEATP